MDYIFSIDLSSYLNSTNDKELTLRKCALSRRNIFAFSNDCYIYMLPLEKPNELIPVIASNSVCTHLAWSDDGQYLLNAYKNKSVNLYAIKVKLAEKRKIIKKFELLKLTA